ncbi:SMODS domain-containing nucleotidyltransferase [Flavobacterium pectinovorum]|uniref:Nucleotidyltransferase n=1 Tax=Flavobacterium pectinovorum TaxID=29533 RepID=A0A502E433_9FLAO|nr:nucleotidyltransferase [Flavobacterium pectinovorum]TPG31316.1 nucleotidyltransferase [Flavobacterium pectinovorum]
MAKNVNQAFEEFNKDIVNLIKENTDNARSSRDWLITQLLKFPENVDNFPNDYPEKHLKIGSFSRNTKIRPLDDIDLMYCLGAGDAYYKVDTYDNKKYYIQTENAVDNLKNLSNDDNTLNSIKVVNKLVKALETVPQYANAEINRNQEVAVLNLSSYSWSYDIVPCFYTVNNFYLMPDGSGNWKATNPEKDQENIRNTNINNGGKVYQLVRTLKYWNANFTSPKLGSYLFEILIINFVKSKNTQNEYNDINIKDFFYYLYLNIRYDVQDPKGIQGNINNLTVEQRDKISNKAKSCYDTAVIAIDFEIEKQNQQKAIENWKIIFGDKFPSYE